MNLNTKPTACPFMPTAKCSFVIYDFVIITWPGKHASSWPGYYSRGATFRSSSKQVAPTHAYSDTLKKLFAIQLKRTIDIFRAMQCIWRGIIGRLLWFFWNSIWLSKYWHIYKINERNITLINSWLARKNINMAISDEISSLKSRSTSSLALQYKTFIIPFI